MLHQRDVCRSHRMNISFGARSRISSTTGLLVAEDADRRVDPKHGIPFRRDQPGVPPTSCRTEPRRAGVSKLGRGASGVTVACQTASRHPAAPRCTSCFEPQQDDLLVSSNNWLSSSCQANCAAGDSDVSSWPDAHWQFRHTPPRRLGKW